MGLLLGLLLGVGLFLCVVNGGERRPRKLSAGRRTEQLIAESGLLAVRPAHLALVSLASAGIIGGAVVTISATWSIALASSLFAAAAPWFLLHRLVARRRRERRDLWPYVIDDLASGIRAGLSLPEAVAAVADRGPQVLRPAFQAFAGEFRATGSFAGSVGRLAEDLADPVADRVVEALLLAREVGGTDVGRLLRGLGQALRDDARARGEIEARQSWTVNGARLALAAPWAVLLLLAGASKSVRVYDTPGGLAVLVCGGALSALAYVLMRRIGRLPQERRLLGSGA